MSEWYRRDGSGPIPYEQWIAEGHELGAAARIAYTDIGDVYVSTIFLGMNHRWAKGPPLIFETMVFGGVFDREQERYPTEPAALAGHDQWVALVRESQEFR